MSIEKTGAPNVERPSGHIPSHLGQLVLGVTDLHDAPYALLKAHETLAGAPFDSYDALVSEEQRLSEYDDVKSFEIPVNDFERKVTLWTLRQIFEGRQMLRHNVLRSWPFYEHLYNAHVLAGEQAQSASITSIHSSIEGLQNGEMKECPKCKTLHNLEEFRDSTLTSGYGRFCRHCKAKPTPR